MRNVALVLVATASLLAPSGQARELQELRDRVRDGIQRTDKDLAQLVHRDKLDDQQRARLDSLTEDLDKVREAIAANGKWETEYKRFERAVDNFDVLVKHAPISDGDKQTLGIDVYTLQVVLDAWKAQTQDTPPKR